MSHLSLFLTHHSSIFSHPIYINPTLSHQKVSQFIFFSLYYSPSQLISMEEQDYNGLNLSLTLKPPAPKNPHKHTNHLVNPPPPSKYFPSKLLQMLPSPYNLPPHDKPITCSPTIFKSSCTDMQKQMVVSFEEKRRKAVEMEAEREWERMNKEIVASIEEKRRLEAEMEEERDWELRQERKQRQRREVAEEAAAVVSPPNSTVSTGSLSGKKRGEREESYEAEKDLSVKYIITSEEDETGGDALSKEQAAVLEETFKENNSPRAKEKIEMAKQLNLRPRQVEVWFQNRRARIELEQTEVNYDNLKTCCEIMRDENICLKKELTELRAFKHFHQSYMNKFPPTIFVLCPQCTRVTKPSSSSTQVSSAAGDAANTNH